MEETYRKEKLNMADVAKLLWIAIKLGVAIFAIFHASNVTILYQGF